MRRLAPHLRPPGRDSSTSRRETSPAKTTSPIAAASSRSTSRRSADPSIGASPVTTSPMRAVTSRCPRRVPGLRAMICWSREPNHSTPKWPPAPPDRRGIAPRRTDGQNSVGPYRSQIICPDFVQSVRRPILLASIMGVWHRLFRIGFSIPNVGGIEPLPRRLRTSGFTRLAHFGGCDPSRRHRAPVCQPSRGAAVAAVAQPALSARTDL